MFLNGKPLCVAGVRSGGYISAYVTSASEENKTWIDVLGLDNRKKLYVGWTRTKLRTGDEVLIKVVDRTSVDKYRTIRRLIEKEDIESIKRHTRRMAKAFGWEITEKRKAK